MNRAFQGHTLIQYILDQLFPTPAGHIQKNDLGYDPAIIAPTRIIQKIVKIPKTLNAFVHFSPSFFSLLFL